MSADYAPFTFNHQNSTIDLSASLRGNKLVILVQIIRNSNAKLVPRVLRLLGQRVVAGRDSGVYDFISLGVDCNKTKNR